MSSNTAREDQEDDVNRGRKKPPKQPDLLCLNASELKAFEVVRRYVKGMCGPASDGDVLRYLIRDWEPK